MQPPRSEHFRQGDNLNIVQNEAFLLSDAKTRAGYARAYESSSALYCADKPSFAQILAESN